MNKEQKILIEENLFIVKYILWQCHIYNHSISGMTYQDLFQEGSLALCEAALTYQEEKGASFHTFAAVVVRNHILSCCKKAYNVSRTEAWTELAKYEKGYTMDEGSTYIKDFLIQKQRASKGVTRKGIVSIRLKIAGYKNRDIAKFYGVENTQVGAWISRASQKLKQDEDFKKLIA